MFSIGGLDPPIQFFITFAGCFLGGRVSPDHGDVVLNQINEIIVDA